MGDELLARITYRAKGVGSFPLDFVPFNGADPNNPTGSRFSRTMPSVPNVAVQWDDGQTTIEVD
jgi:hypothetical protein